MSSGKLKNFKFWIILWKVLIMDGFDLTKYQEDEEEKAKLKNILGKVLSGREGYEVAEETKVEKQKRCKCGWPIEPGQKFCPECGRKQT